MILLAIRVLRWQVKQLLINAKRPRVDCFRHNEEGPLVLRSYELGTKLELTSVDLSISLDDIYEDVGFRSAI
jgi:Uma2 family endonuclease